MILAITSKCTTPASCRVSLQTLRKLNICAGSWILVASAEKEWICRLWPTDNLNNSIVEVCNTIERIIKNFEISEEISSVIKPLNDMKLASEIVIDANTEADETFQLEHLGYIFNNESEEIRTQTVYSMLNNLIIQEGFVVRSRPPFLVLRIVKTVPTSVPVLVTFATRITWISTNTNMIGVHAVDARLSTLSLHIREHTSPPGLQKAYKALLEVVSYPLLYRNLISTLGIECPKGVLLYGPPGVGKTLLVYSVAKACNAKTVVINGPEVYGPYVGQSEERLRKKFSQARIMSRNNNDPVILFIDEIDSLAPPRSSSASHESRVVAQLLTLMDGIESRGRLIVIGATNRPNSIDPALRRPGRFDREVAIDVPDQTVRHEILKELCCNLPLAENIDLELLAGLLKGYVGADLAALCREASLTAIHRVVTSECTDLQSPKISFDDFKVAIAHTSPSLRRGIHIEVEKMEWSDIGGLYSVKKALQQAVEWPIMYRSAFIRLGLRPPRGILLYGPPGCSKTTLVKIIATTSGASFLSINGAQLYSSYVGDSEKTIRDTFQRARSSSPSLIFFDEIDAIVGKRSFSQGSDNGKKDSVQERVLSTLLNEMDGIEGASSVLIVGATNRPEVLDAALMRPGRFDRLLYVPPPDEETRLQILKIHCRKIPLEEDVDFVALTKQTNNYTGADLENLCREAALIAFREVQSAQAVRMEHFTQAFNIMKPSLNMEILMRYKKINELLG